MRIAFVKKLRRGVFSTDASSASGQPYKTRLTEYVCAFRSWTKQRNNTDRQKSFMLKIFYYTAAASNLICKKKVHRATRQTSKN